MRGLVARPIWLVLLSLAVCDAAPAQGAGHSVATLRVGLWTLWRDKEITVSAQKDGHATLRNCESCRANSLDRTVRIGAIGNRVSMEGSRGSVGLWLSGTMALSAHGETLVLRHPLHIAAREGVLILAVTLPVETYVERVVASESGTADSPESLKALAIVVRSFALHQSHGHADYDLCDSTHCQLLHWGGNPDRRAAAHAATLATAGETLWYHGHRAEAWFHQNCGGRTASPVEVWRTRKPMPWLASHADSYCTEAGAREWSTDLGLGDLTATFAAAGLVRPGWKTLAVVRRGGSGRAVLLRAGSTEISAEDFRLAVGRTLGWNRILSTWFEVNQQGDRFYFHGRGSGHGVGLCQAGGAAMAAVGRDAGEILAYYFPGANVSDEASGRSWRSFRGPGLVLETLNSADSSILPRLSHALAEAENRSGLTATSDYTVRSFASTPEFRNATLAPGWVAAFTEGNWIGAQPLGILASRRMLESVMRHEFLHALVESRAGPQAPLWLREGLVEVWSGDAQAGGPAPRLRLADVDHALARSVTERESATAHRAAGWYAGRLLTRYGRAQALAWLRDGLPPGALAAIE